MDNAVLIAGIAAIPGVIGSYFAYRQSKIAGEKASRTEAQKVEAGAYERARKMYENGIKQLEEQVERLRKQVRDEQTASDTLRNQIRDLEETVYHLRNQLINSGIELAPEVK